MIMDIYKSIKCRYFCYHDIKHYIDRILDDITVYIMHSLEGLSVFYQLVQIASKAYVYYSAGYVLSFIPVIYS